MPREVLKPDDTTNDHRPLAGFFGKVPATGDFVARGVPVAFRRHWDTWITHNIAPLQHEGLEFPLGGLRFRLVSDGRLVAGVILPSADSAGRRFPLSLLLIAEGNLSRSQIDAWCDAGLALLPAMTDVDALWVALDAVPAPDPDGPATGPMLLWTAVHPELAADPMDPASVLERLLAS